MSKTYNGLVKPILLFEKELDVFIPKAGIQPAYGPWNNLDEAKQGLIEEFEDIANVPSEYTFCVLDSNGKPREWWFTEAGVWDTIKQKSLGDSLYELLKFKIVGDTLYVSYTGGDPFYPIAEIPDLVGNFVTDVELSDNGEILISYNNGVDWISVGKVLFEITSSGYFKYSFDGGITWNSIKIYAANSPGTTPSGSEQSPSNLGTLTSENLSDVEFQNSNDSSSGTYSGQEACDVLVYMATDYTDALNAYMQSNYPSAAIGDFIIVRSTMYDRTGGMSNASDATHTYELDPTWTTQDVLTNSSQTDWYHYYKITKVDADKWAALAWVGRTAQYVDAVRYTVRIGEVTPQEASIVAVYNGVTYSNLSSGSVITVDSGASLTITASAEGYTTSTIPVNNITENKTIDISLNQEDESMTITFTIALMEARDKTVVWYSTDGFATHQEFHHGDTLNVPAGTKFQVWSPGYTDDEGKSIYCFNAEVIKDSDSTKTYLKKGVVSYYKGWKKYTVRENVTVRTLMTEESEYDWRIGEITPANATIAVSFNSPSSYTVVDSSYTFTIAESAKFYVKISAPGYNTFEIGLFGYGADTGEYTPISDGWSTNNFELGWSGRTRILGVHLKEQ